MDPESDQTKTEESLPVETSEETPVPEPLTPPDPIPTPPLAGQAPVEMPTMVTSHTPPVSEFPNIHPLDKEKLKELSVKGHAATEAMIQAKREKIMALFDSPHHKTFYRTGLTNREVEIALRVSHATVARYLHDLVLAGRLKKVGAGRFLRYVRI